MPKKKNEIKPESYLELRTKTEITKDYTLNLVTLIRVTKTFILGNLQQKIDEEEVVYRKGFLKVEEAIEAHRQIVDILKDLHHHNLLTVFLELL